MSKRVQKPKPTKGYGYVGAWSDNSVGWWLPEFVHATDERRCPSGPNSELVKYSGANRMYLCEITMRPVTDCLGRPITRLAKGES